MTGKEVKALREARKETQRQLALALGVTENSVWRWENGMHAVPGPAVAYLRTLLPPKRSAAA
jgi:DNA-binding transcriptional regulator YiaG